MSPKNPCISCGACCAFFRVSFHWSEADPELDGRVPFGLTEDLPPFRLCMRGTNQRHPRCVALQGEIRKLAQCSIYDQRPEPCREFGVQWKVDRFSIDPDQLERCNRARAHYGLPPLFEGEGLVGADEGPAGLFG